MPRLKAVGCEISLERGTGEKGRGRVCKGEKKINFCNWMHEESYGDKNRLLILEEAPLFLRFPSCPAKLQLLPSPGCICSQRDGGNCRLTHIEDTIALSNST